MKHARHILIALLSISMTTALVSCKEEKGPAGKIGDKIDDALDNRPAEKARDAVENAADEVKDAVR